MTAFYLDASALVKRYKKEVGSAVLDRLFAPDMYAAQRATSFLTVLEVTATILRLQRGKQLDDVTARELLARFRDDVSQRITLLPLDEACVASAAQVVERYLLRSGDAIHLAAVFSLAGASTPSSIVVAASDHELSVAARAAGFEVLDPEDEGALERLSELLSPDTDPSD